MAVVKIKNLLNLSIDIPESTKPLLHYIHAANIDYMHACGKKGRCTTCKAVFVEGIENTTPLTQAEERLAATGRLRSNERLACQVSLTGDATIRVPEQYKLPHVAYSE